MSNYQGMRWFKADFQVQTPEDSKNWSDVELRLGNPRRARGLEGPDETEISSKARTFLKRCHDLELQIIGITDHNFSGHTDPRDWFLTHLLEQNKSVARELGREPIYILPGFEVDIGYHVLCLFEPTGKAKDLERVNKVLIQLGLTEAQRFTKGEPTPLRREDSTVSMAKLLKVVQEENGGIVIAAHADQNDGLLERPSNRLDYQLPDLLAIEVTQYPLSQKVASILGGKNPEWSRPGKQPAYVQSSDAKSLATDDQGNPKSNSLGYRYTWVKCSQPSIAALKQAFLDSESRISIDKESPDLHQTFPRIVSLTIKGSKYLEDQTIAFSRNLNTLIGARGTGKSTILELLRIMFARHETESLSDRAKQKAERAKGTFTPDTEILVEWESIPGELDRLRYTPNEGLSLVQGEVHDLPTYLRHLPVQFYSQQQLTDLTASGSQPQLLRLVDELCTAELEKLQGEERTVAADIKRLFAAKDQAQAVQNEITNLKQELLELERQWQARKDVQKEAEDFQNSSLAKRYFKTMSEAFDKDLSAVDQALKLLHTLTGEPFSVTEKWPHSQWLSQQAKSVSDRRAAHRKKLAEVLADMQADFSALFTQNQRWKEIEIELDGARDAFVSACEAKGIQPQDVSRLQELDRTKQAKLSSLQDKERQWKELEGVASELEQSLARLFGLWNQQYMLREKIAREISEKTGGSIRVLIRPMAYESSFMIDWDSLEPDRRSRLGKEWDSIGTYLFRDFLKAEPGLHSSPWEYIEWLMQDLTKLPGIVQQFKTELPPYLESMHEKWRQLRLIRVPDLVDIELYRQDRGQHLIGSVGGRQLSEGQRNTAILNLLLVRGFGPIIIDQPEDEVDTSFIYRDLVPLLKQAKSQRQLILATHNANLPVNADSEFVYALKSEQGVGRLLAQGGTDRKATATAILDIMEGSEEAFKRRFEKYHF
ncbi:TrlF family AAA-like ATPase [Stutzerimonas nitrititolerans]|uniref:TrlF family AAA-like ATPase n=1 Tax=Stutzerimonas nitrititolerans TaxID=2482751 RepID=UPI002897F725|nr:AAA family ATPase [Stutzerimonas nitrititolerans]